MAETSSDIRNRRIVLALATSTGGVGQHVTSLAEGLLARGAHVAVVGPQATEDLFHFTEKGCLFRAVEISSGPDPVTDTRAVGRLRHLLVGSDVVHAHGLRAGMVTTVAVRSMPAAKQPALVCTWHNILMASGAKERLYEAMERVVARGPDITLGASEDLVERAHRLGAGDARMAPVAAPPMDPPTRTREEVRAELGVGDEPLLLSVGRLHPQKDFPTLITASLAWKERDPVPLLVIAGSGPSEEELQAMIDETGAPVRLLGRRSDVPDLLQAADLVVLSSKWEARALVAQEACRAGRPLVSTAVGGLPGLLGGGAAVLVPDGDPEALSQAVTRLLDDPEEAARLARRGKEISESWPDEEDTVDQVAAVYAELLGPTS